MIQRPCGGAVGLPIRSKMVKGHLSSYRSEVPSECEVPRANVHVRCVRCSQFCARLQAHSARI
eukprot:6469418-Alexandrium_andersonii.AAC.1